MNLRKPPRGALASFALAATLASNVAVAQQGGSITQPGAHLHYALEVEPHMAFGFAHYRGYGAGVGPGVRVTFPLSHEGLVPEINNSVGIGVGLDLLFHDSSNTMQFPVVMQWNFHFHKRFSAFFEPGLGFGYTFSDGKSRVFPAIAIGMRVHFSNKQALVLRLGYPAAALGLSFFF
jgi:hypothetical protein